MKYGCELVRLMSSGQRRRMLGDGYKNGLQRQLASTLWM